MDTGNRIEDPGPTDRHYITVKDENGSTASQRINECSIFNRFGQRTYLSTRQEDTWDGTFNGKECEMSVYFYYLRYICSDGNEYVKKETLPWYGKFAP